MQEHSLIKPIGLVLQEADLVSSSQIEVALRDQSQFKHLLLGEILALRGWVKQETADFFVQHWPTLVQTEPKQPLGYYLKSAALLDEHQIETILQEQLQIGLRFGALAVLKGWLKQTTINFFLEYLAPQDKLNSPFIKKCIDFQPNQQQVLFIGEPQITIPQTQKRRKIKTDSDLAEALDYTVPWLVTYQHDYSGNLLILNE